jgi:hypothetical protein
METKYEDYYKEQLSTSLEFQDFVADVLYHHGIVIMNYGSKKYQIEKGENKIGCEIKNDKKFRDTGNFWIELKEKSNPYNIQYIESGINRVDNTWIYIIGDNKTLYIFGKKMLSFLSRKYKARENKTKTSIGFLLPIIEAEKYCEKKIDI